MTEYEQRADIRPSGPPASTALSDSNSNPTPSPYPLTIPPVSPPSTPFGTRMWISRVNAQLFDSIFYVKEITTKHEGGPLSDVVFDVKVKADITLKLYPANWVCLQKREKRE